MKAHTKLLLALVGGAVAGIALNPFAQESWLQAINAQVMIPVGQVFLRLIFMIVVPMVFSALVIGVFDLAKSHGLGKVAKSTLIFTVLASASSVLIGVSLVNALQPGKGFQIDAQALAQDSGSVAKIQENVKAAKPAMQALVEMIPKNPIDSASRALDGEMIPLMVFALIFGIALSLVQQENKGQNFILGFLEQLFAASMKIVEFAMAIAPYAVFALVFSTCFKFGYGILVSLFFYVAVVLIALLLQQFVVYSFLLKTMAGRSPFDFFRTCRDVYLYAFATASSNATLPLSLETAEQKLKLDPDISRFVLTIGSTANQNGTALFEGITVLFLAQVYGIDLTLGQQVQVVLMSILAGVGTAGVPGGSLPLIMILVQQMGIPVEGMGIILGVDRFLDMCRTTLNVSGDLVIAALVDKHAKPSTQQG